MNIHSIHRHNIKVAGISSDGDCRLLASMKHNFKFNTLASNNEWLGDSAGDICFLQDIVHIGTKLRNRLLNSLVILLIGNKVASVAHLKMLLNLASKDIHGLTYSDICPDDRQNFGSLKKIMEMRVRDTLKLQVLHSEGTIEFIRMCDEITSSLYDEKLSPTERLLRIWRATYFLRAWRFSITQANGLSIDNNFITANCYACIELNAQNLVILIRKFRDENLNEFFLPTIFNSQPCEETFRKMRSMTTTNHTKINFTMLELMHLVGRVELMNDIMYFKLADVDVIFPRNSAKKLIKNKFRLPSDAEIQNCMFEAMNAAITDAKKFGINVVRKNIDCCQLKDVRVNFNSTENGENIDLGIACQENNSIQYQSMRNYENKDTPLNGNSSYIKVNGANGPITIRKSTLMWTISKSKKKLSNDRSIRVRGTKRKNSQRQLEFIDVNTQEQFVYKLAEIKIGDWCIFENILESSGNKSKFILGNILSFKYANGKTFAEKNYAWDFASIKRVENKQEVEAMALWYRLDINGDLFAFECTSCSFIRNQHYVANLLHKVIDNKNNKLGIAQEYLTKIQNELKTL